MTTFEKWLVGSLVAIWLIAAGFAVWAANYLLTVQP